MQPLTRSQRVAAGLWIVMALVIWNLVYDLLLTRAVQEYMFRVALHQAGRGPLTTMAEVLDREVYYAVWVSTLFASIVALAGFVTIRILSTRRPDL